jgi:hypothetical protein
MKLETQLLFGSEQLVFVDLFEADLPLRSGIRFIAC